MTVVAIMQPTYLPWAGYFGLMDRVDRFVLLDSVQFDRRSWQQRNRIKTAHGPQWLTVPVHSKGLRDQTIGAVRIDTGRDFPKAHLVGLRTAYGKTPFFRELFPQVEEILTRPREHLADLTIEIITWARDLLGIRTPLDRSSTLAATGAKAELLAALCLEVGADRYLSPPGSRDYLDDSDAFDRQGIPVDYFHFQHPEYPQPFGSFEPYMCILDLLFNIGPGESLQQIRAGCLP
ncbi:MAG: WbqC family protein [Magnetococcales bacterium]|nr:WbqC family protein [Magnetococcales bacterium]